MPFAQDMDRKEKRFILAQWLALPLLIVIGIELIVFNGWVLGYNLAWGIAADVSIMLAFALILTIGRRPYSYVEYFVREESLEDINRYILEAGFTEQRRSDNRIVYSLKKHPFLTYKVKIRRAGNLWEVRAPSFLQPRISTHAAV